MHGSNFLFLLYPDGFFLVKHGETLTTLPGVPAALAVTPILVHRTPPVHGADNLDDEEIQDAQKQRRLSAASALRIFGEETWASPHTSRNIPNK